MLDDDEDKSYHVAEVLTVVNEQVNVHYWGTTTKKLETAKGPTLDNIRDQQGD